MEMSYIYIYMAILSFKTYSYQTYLLLRCQFKKTCLKALLCDRYKDELESLAWKEVFYCKVRRIALTKSYKRLCNVM